MKSLPHLGITGLPQQYSELLPGSIYALVIDLRLGLDNYLSPAFFEPCLNFAPVLYIAQSPLESLQQPAQQAHWPPANQLQVLALNYGKNTYPSEIKGLLLGIQQLIEPNNSIHNNAIHNVANRPASDVNNTNTNLLNRNQSVTNNPTNHNVVFFEMPQFGDLKNDQLERLINRELSFFYQWLANKNFSLVLVIKNSDSNYLLQTTLLTQNNLLAGVASIHQEQQQVIWQSLYWHSEFEVTATIEFLLTQPPKSQQWHAKIRQTHTASNEVQTSTQTNNLVVLDGVIHDAHHSPDTWLMVGSIDEAIQQAKACAPQAVILGYETSETFHSLLEKVITLRRQLASCTKILVREIGTQLRHQEQRLTIQLGASGILPKELNFSRCLQMIETVISKPLPPPSQAEAARVLQEIQQNTQQGYLLPNHFVTKVKQALISGKKSNVEHALVKFTLISGMQAEHCIVACKTQRNGDYFTSGNHHIYLFIEGCRENDLEKAIKHVFKLPVTELFHDETYFCHSYDIIRELKYISNTHQLEQWPDLREITQQFQSSPSGPTPLTKNQSDAHHQTHNSDQQEFEPPLIPLPIRQVSIKAQSPAVTDSDLELVSAIIENKSVTEKGAAPPIPATSTPSDKLKPTAKTSPTDKLVHSPPNSPPRRS
ncbi:MAG: hypothetical protein COB04_11045 [Gammaproteobacteria bacterium]|nr:MAG: hypothetical protein COB04_11045 [Gammaproteobacteria bacterium]